MTRVITTSVSDEDYTLLKKIGWASALKKYAALLREQDTQDLQTEFKRREESINKLQNTIARLSTVIFEKLGKEEYEKLFKS